uniref:(California timema) hypothetical protein n=1 Tax=Timema californicum TaxID=61474 RepID=A0A7R9J4K1_TIMCA|nr:unnamed protein product [Timema californicum]
MAPFHGRGAKLKGVLAKHGMFHPGRSPRKPGLFQPKMGKTARVMVFGMKGVGKTAILEQLIYGNITSTSELHPTIEDIYVANIETDRGTREKVRFYDTEGLIGGGREVSPVTRQCAGLVDAYVLVYDTDKPESLDVLIAVKRDIDRNRDKKEAYLMVIGNKTRPTEAGSLENTASKAAHWAVREKMRHYEVNAMERATLYEPFVALASKLNPPPTKSSFPQLSMVRKTIGRPDNS